jgi:hypothetical protein
VVGAVVVVVACEVVVPADAVVPVDALVPVGVAVPVGVLVLVGVTVVLVAVVVAAGGNGAPAVGGSVEAFGPVTSAPFLAVIVTNEDESGAWMLASAPAMLPPCFAVRYPTAPGGGMTRPIAAPNRWIR